MSEGKIIAVIGDADLQEDSKKISSGREPGQSLIDHKFRLITGARSRGKEGLF